MSFFRAFLLCAFLLSTSSALAQLDLQAIGLYKDLGQDEFYGAVYMNSAPSASSLNNHEVEKQLEFRIIKSKISNSSFNRSLAQAISINNKRDDLARNQKAIIEFTKALEWDLVKGDSLVISSNRKEVRYSLNGDTIFTTNNLELFSIVANTWYGSRPISVAFKRELSATDISSHSSAFSNLKPSKSRKNIVAKLRKAAEKEKKRKALARKKAEEKRLAEKKLKEERARKAAEEKRRQRETAIANARLKKDKAAFTRSLIVFKTDLRNCEKENRLSVTSKTLDRYESSFREYQNTDVVRDFVQDYPNHSETRKFKELVSDSVKCLNSLRAAATKNFNAKRNIEGNINVTDSGISQGVVYVVDDKKLQKSTTTLSYANNRFSDRFIFVKPGDTLKVRNRDRSTTHFIALDMKDNVLFDFGLQAPSKSFEREINWRGNSIIKIANKNALNSFAYIVNIPSNQYQLLSLNADKSFFQLNNVPARINQVKLLTIGDDTRLIEIPLDKIINNKAPLFKNSGVVAELSIKQ